MPAMGLRFRAMARWFGCNSSGAGCRAAAMGRLAAGRGSVEQWLDAVKLGIGETRTRAISSHAIREVQAAGAESAWGFPSTGYPWGPARPHWLGLIPRAPNDYIIGDSGFLGQRDHSCLQDGGRRGRGGVLLVTGCENFSHGGTGARWRRIRGQRGPGGICFAFHRPRRHERGRI